jgi:hypothetical protein
MQVTQNSVTWVLVRRGILHTYVMHVGLARLCNALRVKAPDEFLNMCTTVCMNHNV